MIYVRSLGKRFGPSLLLMAGALGLLIAATLPAQTQTLTTLYSFGSQSPDGAYPWGGLVLAGGKLYGTTAGGGMGWGYGVAFEVNIKKKTETLLYEFVNCQECGPVLGYPGGGLVRDSKGNFYGSTGDNSSGYLYEITASGTVELLYTFTGSPDGINPEGSLIDAKGNLYGTTVGGGYSPQGGCPGPDQCGTVFEWSPTSGEKVLYSFNFNGATNTDGMWPVAGLVRDSKGNLYGTTYHGGSDNCGYGCGTVFEVMPKGTEKVLWAFQGGNDGAYPIAGLIRDKAGNLYGTTSGFGVPWANLGSVFELTTSGTMKVLYDFCAVQNCADGFSPQGGLVMDAAGNLYGTTYYGGAYGGGQSGGTIFKLTPQGVYTVLYTFCSQPNCTDGSDPRGSLVRDAKGNLYGVTASGGAYGFGTVFKLTP